MVTFHWICENQTQAKKNAIGELLAPVQHEYPLHLEALQKLLKRNHDLC